MKTPLSRRPLAATLLLAALAAGPAVAMAAGAAPEGVLQLSASASIELPHDWMTLVFATTREGGDAAGVQAQLKQALEAALAAARKAARPGQVEVQTGGFSMSPRYNPRGQINGWQGSTELRVEGRDMAAIGQLAGQISSMTVSRVGYSLSREAREQVEAEVSGQAIARFRARAAEQARQFGYAGYVIREVSVTLGDQDGPRPMPRVMMAAARMSDDAPLPVEAGKGNVTATVSGAVQMK